VGLAAAVALALIGAPAVLWMGRTAKSPVSARDDLSIAVMPFEDLSPEKNQQYFSEGLAAELLDALARIPGLRVAPRTSSFRFGANNKDARVIGQKLNVANLLEGSVHKQANRARVSVRLIRASDGAPVWAETYDKELNDILAAEELARGKQGDKQVAGRGGCGVREDYARGIQRSSAGPSLLGRRNKENLRGQRLLEEATRLILDMPGPVGWEKPARSGWSSRFRGRAESLQTARDAVQRVKLTNSAEVHRPGWIQMNNDRDWGGADGHSNKRWRWRPGTPPCQPSRDCGPGPGPPDEAAVLGRRAMQLDPLSFGAANAWCRIRRAQRRGRRAFKGVDIAPEAEISRSFRQGLSGFSRSRESAG
jgi:TolB-like protein